MSKMKKTLNIILVVGMLLVLMSGCALQTNLYQEKSPGIANVCTLDEKKQCYDKPIGASDANLHERLEKPSPEN